LKGAYCIAAIWSNLELFLGVIAANLALSHAYYSYLWKSGNSTSTGPQKTGYHGRSGYINQPSFLREEPPEITITSGGRRNSVSRSEASDIPLEPGIHKKTAFTVTEEYPDDTQSER